VSAPVVKPCICGVEIVCIADEIPFGVAAHNATTPHLRWRAAGGMEREVYGNWERAARVLSGIVRIEHGHWMEW
jgi:hypothetical protein